PGEDSDLDQEQDQPEKVQLLEYEKRGNESYWRLAPDCEVLIFPELQAAYHQAKEEEKQQLNINLQERLKMLNQLVERYGNEKGLMGEYQTVDEPWLWLDEQYKHYRAMWLFLLRDTAEQARKSIDGSPTKKQDLQALREAARLYGWAARATNNLFASHPLDENSETYLINSLRCYYLLQDFENACALYQDYLWQRRERNSLWEPRQKTKEIWPEV